MFDNTSTTPSFDNTTPLNLVLKLATDVPTKPELPRHTYPSIYATKHDSLCHSDASSDTTLHTSSHLPTLPLCSPTPASRRRSCSTNSMPLCHSHASSNARPPYQAYHYVSPHHTPPLDSLRHSDTSSNCTYHSLRHSDTSSDHTHHPAPLPASLCHTHASSDHAYHAPSHHTAPLPASLRHSNVSSGHISHMPS
ncbi:hypothetical protein Pcinc_010869 [Petrolisthes cinctipes]|uniref:Uncharacterized protein n=1 Tax=Petrolisthes cinctipes TaxID=88211 RepID=A0AAE1G2H2_PETCI|nr:hypothetical protein Pcinc_010869 [Petrolisthes cinctipes]